MADPNLQKRNKHINKPTEADFTEYPYNDMDTYDLFNVTNPACAVRASNLGDI